MEGTMCFLSSWLGSVVLGELQARHRAEPRKLDLLVGRRNTVGKQEKEGQPSLSNRREDVGILSPADHKTLRGHQDAQGHPGAMSASSPKVLNTK